MDIVDQENAEILLFQQFMAISRIENFYNAIKFKTYGNTHVIFEYFDYSNYFCHFETVKVMKIQEMGRF